VGSKRTLILIAAVLVGALAAYALYTYVNGVEDRAYEDAALVEVYVVKEHVPANTRAEDAIGQKLIARGRIPQEFRPATAVTDLSVLQEKVAQVALDPGQVLVTGMFAEEGKVYGKFSESLDPGEVAVTVAVDQVRGVAGLIRPDDRVNLMVLLAPEGGSPLDKRVQYLYQNVKVLVVGQSTETKPADGTTSDPGTSGLITFGVTPAAAQRIALAADSGGLYLSLAPHNFEPAPVDAATLGSMFDNIPLDPSVAVPAT